MRIEVPPDRLDGHERADQEDQIRWYLKLVRADDADQLAKQEPQVDRVERQLGVRRDDLADVATKSAGINPAAPNIERVQGADHAIGVLQQHAAQKVGDPLSSPAIELPEHAI